MLSADISKGDVEIKTNATGVGDPTGTFGIDADTIVYYYNGKGRLRGRGLRQHG